MPGTAVIVRKSGSTITIGPAPRGGLVEYLRSLEPLDELLPEIEDLPAEPFDL